MADKLRLSGKNPEAQGNPIGSGYKNDRIRNTLSGNVAKMSFQPGVTNEELYTWYEYDARGLLETIKTNTTDNEGTATREAGYTYWPSGAMKQALLGPDPAGSPIAVQTVD